MNNLTVRSPFILKNSINDLFDDFFHTRNTAKEFNQICLDVNEDETSYHIQADLAGIKKEDINLDLSNNILTIKAERKHEHHDKKHHIQECYYGTYERSISLPNNIDKEAIKASFKDGVLTLNIAKSKESQPKKIVINA
jgi:HSP20 family protein